MSAARATKTTLVFGLAAVQVGLYKTAVEQKPPPWDYDEPEPERVEPEPFAPPAAGDPLAAVPDPEPEPAEPEKSERRRGRVLADGRFVDLEDGLKDIEATTKLEEMRVADFIRTEEVRRDRIIGSYYIAPAGDGAGQALVLLHEAMRNTKRAAVVKLSKRTKQTLGVLVPDSDSKSLLLLELAWADDVRARPESLASLETIPAVDWQVEVAEDLVKAMSSTRSASLEVQVDDARALRAELLRNAEAGVEFAAPAKREPDVGGDVVSLMQRGLKDRDALKEAAA
jgi:DNA end-binding protein Ku